MTFLDADHTFVPLSIKLYAWEHAFLRRILFVRNEQELKMLKKIGIFSVRIYPTVLDTEWNASCFDTGNERNTLERCSMYVMTGCPENIHLILHVTVLVAFSSFATAAKVSSKPLTSDVIFPAISLFMLLQFPLAMVSQSSVIPWA